MEILVEVKEVLFYLAPSILLLVFVAIVSRGKSSFSSSLGELVDQIIIPGAVVLGTPFGVLHLYELAFGPAPNKTAAIILLLIGLIPGYIGLSAIEKVSQK